MITAGPKRGGFVHIEFASSDPGRTRKFFEDVFGWEFRSIPGMEYHVYTTPLGPGGAIMPPTPERPAGLLNYILSEDLEGDLRKVAAGGGKVILPKKEIPGVGWWALFEDPTGIVLALYQARSSESGPVARYRVSPPGQARRARGRGRRGTRKK